MHTMAKRALALMIVLLCTIGQAYALEPAEAGQKKLQNFFDALVQEGVITGEETLDDLRNEKPYENTVTTYYALAEYMMLVVDYDPADSRSYGLFTIPVEEPPEKSADELYAIFLEACLDGAVSREEATDIVKWLRENMARTSLYGMNAYKDVGAFTVVMSASMSDAEQSVLVVQYTDDY